MHRKIQKEKGRGESRMKEMVERSGLAIGSSFAFSSLILCFIHLLLSSGVFFLLNVRRPIKIISDETNESRLHAIIDTDKERIKEKRNKGKRDSDGGSERAGRRAGQGVRHVYTYKIELSKFEKERVCNGEAEEGFKEGQGYCKAGETVIYEEADLITGRI
jgi:hypothetical protein